jgi:AmiR/NasT family two-component response regulator
MADTTARLQRQIDALVDQVKANRLDIAKLKADAAVDREMIAELQAEGLVSQKYAAELQRALMSSRTIGTAIGILMAGRGIGQAEAFAVLQTASQHSNRKLRDLATDLVETTERGEDV